MKNKIIETLGIKVLTESLGNPFVFFRLYNQAAKMENNNNPIFTEESIRLLSELEKCHQRNYRTSQRCQIV